MKVGKMVLPDFPGNRSDWRTDWPDDMPGVIIEETQWNTFVVMTPYRAEEINIEYLVEIV